MNTRVEQYLADEATMNWPGMVVGCRGPRWQGRTSSSDYVTPVTAAPCGCTLDCLQPITHRSSRDSCHFPFLRAYARGLQGYRSPPRPPPPRAPLEPAPARPPRAVQGGGTTASNDAQPPPESVFLRKQQPASRSHHFRWKILGPLRGRPGLTLQRASVFNFSFPLFLFPTQEQE